MTTDAHKILVVAPTTSLASKLHRWLCDAGHELTVVTTFAAARAHLRSSPDLVITEVRLGEYNGLQIALYAQAASVPTIVIGAPDAVVEGDARQFGATFVRFEDVSHERMLALTERVIAGADPHATLRTGDQGTAPRDAAAAGLDVAVASGVEWVVAPEIMRPRSGTHARRLTLH